MAKKKILIVDDEPDFVEMLKMRLQSKGYEVIYAFNGNEGLKKTEDHRPDVILLDIMMPQKDGYTMLNELKRNEELCRTPVIVVTAKPGMKDLFEIEGVKDYILKPFEAEDLLLRINRAIG